MDWLQLFTIVAANAGLFFWSRSESKEDHRHLESTMTCMLNGIKDEMKDFHGRLCAIEERNKK